MEELKPCPFCGGEASVYYFAHYDSECTVTCSNPNCRASVSARSCESMTTAYNRARKLWNRRAERTCRIKEECDEVETDLGTMEVLTYWCSVCLGQMSPDDNYCPNCGARVVEEE